MVLYDWRILGALTRTESIISLQKNMLHWPHWTYSTWIDDKALKYIFSGTEAGRYMLDYYFELMEDGKTVRLMDLDVEYDSTLESFATLLRKK